MTPESPSAVSLASPLCSIDAKDLWELCVDSLRPTRSYLVKLNEHLIQHADDDAVFYFEFSPVFLAEDILISKARLVWAGGPLCALTTSGFKEGHSNKVKLSDDDHPVVYSLLRDFLYGKNIDLASISTVELAMQTLKCAHRWDLQVLLHHICQFIKNKNMFVDVPHFVQYVEDAALYPQFQYYFWRAVGKQYSKFVEGDPMQTAVDECGCEFNVPNPGCTRPATNADPNAIQERDSCVEPGNSEESVENDDERCQRFEVRDKRSEDERPEHDTEKSKRKDFMDAFHDGYRLCPNFPMLWAHAINQKVLLTVTRSILEHATKDITKMIAGIILQYVEPRQSGEHVLVRLLCLVKNINRKTLEDMLIRRDADELYSSRGIRLLGKSLISPVDNVERYEWTASLLSGGRLGVEKFDFESSSMRVPNVDGSIAEITVKLECEPRIHRGNIDQMIDVVWSSSSSLFPFSMTVRLSVHEGSCRCTKRYRRDFVRPKCIASISANYTRFKILAGRVSLVVDNGILIDYLHRHRSGVGRCRVKVLVEVWFE